MILQKVGSCIHMSPEKVKQLLLDAVCLAVTANLNSQGLYETIPEQPVKDAKGLTMQMVIPKGRTL